MTKAVREEIVKIVKILLMICLEVFMSIDFLLRLRNPPCATAVLLAVVSRGGEEVCGVGWISERVGWGEKAVRLALKSLVSHGLIVRVHHRGWVAAETAVELVEKVIHRQKSEAADSRLRRHIPVSGGTFPSQAVDLTASDTCIHDDDHHIVNEDKESLVSWLKTLGFYDANKWLETVNVQLVVMWREWYETLPRKRRKKDRRRKMKL